MTISVIATLMARGVLGATFAIAAFQKGANLAESQAAFRGLKVRSDVVTTLIVIEAFTALGLFVERRTAWAAYVAVALMFALTVFVARQVLAGNSAPCACFGSGPDAPPTSLRTLARNIALLAVAVIATGSTSPAHEVWKQQALVFGTATATATATAVAVSRRAARREWSDD